MSEGGAAPSRGPIYEGRDEDGFDLVRFAAPGFSTLFGTIRSRAEADGTARVRVMPCPDSVNVRDTVHGGYLLGFVDQAIFAGAAALGKLHPGDAVTVGVSTQFVGAGRPGVWLDCLVAVTRQTRHLTFVTGSLEQEGGTILTYQATMRTFGEPRRAS